MINEHRFRLKKTGEPNCNCFCRHPELIENYDKAIADTTQTWDCHHRMEAIYTKEELIKYGLYYDREPHQLIFLTHKEHRTLHAKSFVFSEETKRKMSEAHKGKKREPFSEETKRRMSENHVGTTGMHWKLVDGHRVWY